MTKKRLANQKESMGGCKKLKIILVAFLLLPLFGFGCKGLSKQEQAAVAPVALEYWTVYDDVDALQSLVAKYRAARPFLSVNIRQLRPEDIYPRLIEALAEDRGPDIISISNRWLGQFQSKLSPMPSSVKDTTQVITKKTLGTDVNVNTFTVPTINLNQLEAEYVKTVKNDVVRNGNIYGLPLSMDTMAIYYNKDILDRAGIPEAPKTWDEFQANVKKIVKFDKSSSKILQAGAALGSAGNVPGNDDLLDILFRQSGMSFTSSNGQARFNSAPPGNRNGNSPAMSVMDFYTDFANPARDTYTWNESMNNALDSFTAGSVAFFFGYNYHLPIIKARAPQLNFVVIPMLQLNPDAPANVANYWIQTVVEKSKNKNEAWALVNYLTHSPATKEYLDKSGRPTALRTYIAGQKENIALEPFVSQLLIAENWYFGKDYASAQKSIADMIQSWIVGQPDDNYILSWKQGILDRTAARFNQSL